MRLYEVIEENHLLSTRPTNQTAGCTCGQPSYPWGEREKYHGLHVIDEFEKALRKQIATDIQERLVPADQTEVAVWIRNQAARIAEGGVSSDRT